MLHSALRSPLQPPLRRSIGERQMGPWTGYLDFMNGVLDSRITWTRASKAWDYDNAGSLEENANNTAPFDYNSSTLAARGVLAQKQSTNQIRNPRCEGAAAGVIGSGGALPTNFSSTVTGTRTVALPGPIQGVPCFDLNYSGAVALSETEIRAEGAATQVAAAPAEVWTFSPFIQRVLDDANVSDLIVEILALNAAQVEISRTIVSIQSTAGSFLRRSVSHTMPALTAYAMARIRFSYTGTPTLNYTLRIGAPGIEKSAFATSPILPAVGTPAAATRAGDSPAISDLSTIGYNSAEFTVFSEIELQQVNGTVQWRLWELDDGSNTCNVRCNGSSAWVATHGAVSVTGPTITTGIHKVAMSFGAAGVILSVDGTSYTTATPITPVTHTRMTLLASTLASDRQANSWGRRFASAGRQMLAAEMNGEK